MDIFDSELHVLEVIWKEEGITAKEIAKELNNKVGWSRTTTYTVISKCIEKGYVQRKEPKYRCFSLISREEVRHKKVKNILSGLFDNSVINFFSAFAGAKKLTESEKEQLKKLIDEMEG